MTGVTGVHRWFQGITLFSSLNSPHFVDTYSFCLYITASFVSIHSSTYQSRIFLAKWLGFGVFLLGFFGLLIFIFFSFNLVLPELDPEHTPPIPFFQLFSCQVQCKKTWYYGFPKLRSACVLPLTLNTALFNSFRAPCCCTLASLPLEKLENIPIHCSC